MAKPSHITDELLCATDFSGLGSFEEALKRLQVKHRVVFACDKDKYVKKSYLANHQTDHFYDDITQRNQTETSYSDLYTFGFPCQTFSMAGNRKGFEDTRGTLFFNSLSYIKEKKPRVFLAENVKGLLSHDKVKGSKSKYGRTFGIIRDALAITVNGQHNLYRYDDCVDYHLHFFIMNTKNFGIPQNRERIFLIGFKNKSDSIRFQKPKQFQLKLRLKDLLEENVDEKFYLSDKMVDHLLNNSSRTRILKSTDSISPSLLANQAKQSTDSIFIAEPEIVSMRGRNIVNGKRKDYKGAPTKQRLEFNDEAISNTITSVQKDNLIIEPAILTKKRSDYGKLIRKEYEEGNIKAKRIEIANLEPRTDEISNTISTVTKDNIILLFDADHSTNRIYDSKGIARTITANGGGGGSRTGLYKVGYRIRRLTPKECFRLMGFTDDFFERCTSVNSDTQLYKQAGNSIVVNTIMHLLIQILTAIQIPFTYV